MTFEQLNSQTCHSRQQEKLPVMQPADILGARWASRVRHVRPWLRWVAMLLVALSVYPVEASGQGAVRLYMLEDPGCPFCARWTAEVQPGYLKSPEAAFAPLIRRYRTDPEVARFPRVNHSPTFILVRGQEEIGRIVGYMGADLFWVQLDELMKRAGFPPPN
jgi:hypothetical protein